MRNLCLYVNPVPMPASISKVIALQINRNWRGARVFFSVTRITPIFSQISIAISTRKDLNRELVINGVFNAHARDLVFFRFYLEIVYINIEFTERTTWLVVIIFYVSGNTAQVSNYMAVFMCKWESIMYENRH